MPVQHETQYAKADHKGKIWYVETHLVEHCNINCNYCDHFSSIAAEHYADLNIFKRDLTRIKELSSGMERLRLLGGEPLLHPNLTDFFDAARAIFPNIIIDLITNGVLVPKMPAAFFDSIKENNIAVATSPYFKADHAVYKAINATYDRHQVPAELRLYMGSYFEKKFSFIALDRTGKQDPQHSFKNCWHAAFRIFLRDGKIYPCPIAPNVTHFNNRFPESKEFQLTENDFCDIYKVKTEQEVMDFLSKPIDFCRFCNVDRRTDPLFVYQPTCGEQKEWVYN